MGFASKYEGVDRVDVGDGYWVDIKKALTWAESEAAEKAGFGFAVAPNLDDPKKTRTNVSIDPEAKMFEMVLASVVDWNLDNDDGSKWPLDYDRALEAAGKAKAAGQGNAWKSPRRRSLERLPKPVADLLQAEVGKRNQAMDEAKAQSFRPGGGLGDPGQQDGQPDDPEVLYGAEVVATAGDNGGSPALAGAPGT